MVHGVIMEPCGCQGCHQALLLWAVIWVLSSDDLTSTSSHIYGSWYLPIFLFRDGSLTLINITSLMALTIFQSSLPTMLKLSGNSSWPVVLWWSCMSDSALMCSLNLSAKVLPDSPMYSSSQSTLPHFYLWITPLFCSMVSLSLGCTRALWWYCLLWNAFLPHVSCRCSCSFHLCLVCMGYNYIIY